ncbi:MAG: TlpA family protein disulfide reductase [Acidimicrobiales bacterium]
MTDQPGLEPVDARVADDHEPANDTGFSGGTRRPRGRGILITAVVIGSLLAGFVGILATRDSSTARLAQSPLLGKLAPELKGLSLLDGATFDLADVGERFVLVNVFATWCVPCQEEQPELVAFDARHTQIGDVRVVSVVFSDEADAVKRFFAERGGSWPVLDDPDGRVALDWGVSGVPESYLVSPDGIVRAKIVGGVTEKKLDELLAQLVSGGQSR